MSNKIVYLFGAGASYHAIPVVSGMKTRLQTFLEYYNNNRNLVINMNVHSLNRKGKLVILEKYKELVKETSRSFSIDTLARKFFLRGDMNKLNDVKELIAAYLVWEQVVNKEGQDRINTRPEHINVYVPATNYFSYFWKGSSAEPKSVIQTDIPLESFDYRYESLFSVLADKRNKLSENVSFISWNYDNQVEIAIDRVFNIEGNEKKKNRTLDSIFDNRFIKLNGSAGLSNFDWEPVSKFNSEKDERLKEIAEFLSVEGKTYPNRIKFAWENDKDLPRNRASMHLQEADELVIIGYSFPDYNRKVDYQMLNEFWGTTHTKKITIQDTLENADKVAQRVKSITNLQANKDNIKIYTELQQFYIPPIYLAG